MRRAIEIEGTDTTLELSRAINLRLGAATLFHLDRLPDGTWRVTFDDVLVPDMTRVSGLTLKNAGGNKPVNASITFDGPDVTLPLEKIVGIVAPDQRIYLEKTKSGGWALLYSRDLIPDISAVKSFRIIRED